MTSTQKAIFPGIVLGVFVLVMLSRLVNPNVVVSAATEAAASIEEPSTSCSNPEQYPTKVQAWCGLIESSASKYGVDSLLVASVMLQESGGQPEIMAASGAVGLMQVMPSDGIAAGFQCVNGPCFASRPTIAELKDPAFNVD